MNAQRSSIKARYQQYRALLFRKRFLIPIAVLALCIVGALAIDHAVTNVLPYSPIRPHRVSQREIDSLYGKLTTPQAYGLKADDLVVVVDDTITLKGWFVHARTDTALGTIILLHGIANTRVSMLATASELCQAGFNCVLYDSRANGESGGLNCTFGFYEKHDLATVIDIIDIQIPSARPFGVFGSSMGAAVALQAMSIDKRIACGVVECPFTTLRQVIYDYFRQQFIVPIQAIPNAVLKHSERIANFPVDSVQPVVSARSITQPVMVVHGSSDTHIRPEYGREVFDNLASPQKVWFPIEWGEHNNLIEVGGERYRIAVKHFFVQQLSTLPNGHSVK